MLVAADRVDQTSLLQMDRLDSFSWTPGTCNSRKTISSKSHPLSFTTFTSDQAQGELYVDEQNKFAMCLIPKNGCTEWSMLCSRLYHKRVQIDTPQYGIARKVFSPEAAMKVFSDKEAIRVVFVRDPLQRVLSAYLDKCVDHCSDSDHGCPRSLKGRPFGDMVNFLRDHFEEISHDTHWQLQSQHCELYQRVNEYTHVIPLSQSTFHEDSSCILHAAGLDWVNVDSQNTSQSFWSGRSHCAGPTMHKSDDNVKSFYTQELAEIVMKIYEDDYKLLGIPHPSWINEVTGELAHEVACTGTMPSKVQEHMNLQKQGCK